MKKDLSKAFQYVDDHREETLALYKEFINHESWSRNKAAVKAFSDILKAEMEKEGFECEYIPVGGPEDQPRADMLVGTWGKERPGKPVLFIGHMDTVFETGQYKENPFEITCDRRDGESSPEPRFAHGPGVLDMKGGILIALNTVKALKAMGWAERPIKFAFAGDEEINHEYASTDEELAKACEGGLVCFNMETGLIDNNLCIGRNACQRWRVAVEGKETHSGNDFWGGRSSIVEMASKIMKFHELNKNDFGNTINIGTIKGGTVPNAVPAHCEVVLDIRYNCAEGGKAIMDAVHKICESEPFIEGTTTSLTFLNKLEVYETTDDVKALLEFVKKTAKEYDLPAIEGRRLGGGSDSSCAQRHGVPTLDSCGIRGQWNHTMDEYADIEALFDRTKMWASVIANIDDFKF